MQPSEWLLCLPLMLMAAHRAAVCVAAQRLEKRTEVPAGAGGGPAITWLRPLKGGVPELAAKLQRFTEVIGPDDQVILGAERGSAEEAMCRQFVATDERLVLVSTRPGPFANPKIAKLSQMTPHAARELWVVLDSEADVDADFIERFRAELGWAGGDAVTAGYRFTGMRTAIEWLDVLPSIQTLWPGLRLVAAFGQIRWTLGACTGFHRDALQSIGGWAAVGDELAEDHRFGLLLVRAGRRIRLSTQVLTLEADPLSWTGYWRHQRRLAITYRVATPAGAAGMILPHGFTLCLLLAVLVPTRWTALNLGIAMLIHLSSVAIEARRLGYRVGSWLLLSLVADLVESACWVLSWASGKVWWGGKWRRIDWRGRLDRER